MVERFTITAAEQDPWIDADANGQWVRYSDYAALEARLAERVDDAEALSRTGAVKVKALGDWRRGYCDDEVTIEQVSTGFGSIYQVRIFEGTIWLDYPVREKEAFPTVEAAKAAAQADYERRILSALEATPPAPMVTATHRHKKRGTEYVLLGFGKMQARDWVDHGPELDYDAASEEDCVLDLREVDMREVAIYRSIDDGSLWVRPREEFEDGRFEALTASEAK